MCIAWSLSGGIGVLVGLFSLWNLARQLTALRWSSTQGVVEDHVVRRRVGPNDETMYEASPRYAYEVGGARFRGDRFSYADTSRMDTQQGAVEAIARRFPAGSTVAVYYDPRHPERAVIDRGMRWFRPAVGLAAGAFLVVASRMFDC